MNLENMFISNLKALVFFFFFVVLNYSGSGPGPGQSVIDSSREQSPCAVNSTSCFFSPAGAHSPVSTPHRYCRARYSCTLPKSLFLPTSLFILFVCTCSSGVSSHVHLGPADREPQDCDRGQRSASIGPGSRAERHAVYAGASVSRSSGRTYGVPTDVHQPHPGLHSLHIQLTDSIEKFTYRKLSPKHLERSRLPCHPAPGLVMSCGSCLLVRQYTVAVLTLDFF